MSADSEKPPRKLKKLTERLFESLSSVVDLEARKAALRKQQEEMRREAGQKRQE